MKIFFLFIMLVIAAVARPQDAAFVVYFSKGQALKQLSKTRLAKGDQLSKTDVVELRDGSELILICSNYQTVRLNKKGRYSVKYLQEQCSRKNTSFTATYFKYVWNELLNKHGSVESNPTAYMRNTGAVSRGCPYIETSVSLDTIYYASGPLPVRISSAFLKTHLYSHSRPEGGEPDHKIEVDPSKPVQLERIFSLLNRRQKAYYWQFAEEGGATCDPNVVLLVTQSEMDKKKKLVLRHVVATTPAETAFLKGYLLEENYLLAEAVKQYTEAFALEPQNARYREAVERFQLLR